MQIRRTVATHIMSRALSVHETSLLGILDRDEILYAADAAELDELVKAHPDAALVYNQNELALQVLEQIAQPDGQYSLEVFQDTEGVFGLRAYRMQGKVQTPVTLELLLE